MSVWSHLVSCVFVWLLSVFAPVSPVALPCPLPPHPFLFVSFCGGAMFVSCQLFSSVLPRVSRFLFVGGCAWGVLPAVFFSSAAEKTCVCVSATAGAS